MATLRCGDKVFTNIQAVIFDKDGTLANVEGFLCDLAHRRSQAIEARIPGVRTGLLQAFGIQRDYPFRKQRSDGGEPFQLSQSDDRLNAAGLMAVGSRQENEIAAAGYIAATGKGWVESLDLVQQAFEVADRSIQLKAKQTPLLSGAVPLFQKLAAAGLRLGILSSDRQKYVDEFVELYQLSRYFRVTVGVQNHLSKSDPKLLEQVFSTLGTLPAQTLMIGDSQVDLQLAATANMAGCVGFMGGWSSQPNLINASVLIDRLDQIQVIQDDRISDSARGI